MKKRNLFITLGLALGLGVGVFAGLKAGQEVKEVKAAATDVDIYLNVSGSSYWESADAVTFVWVSDSTSVNSAYWIATSSIGNGVYKFTLPAGYDKATIARLNPTNNATSNPTVWDGNTGVWSQAHDFTYEGAYNYVSLKADSDGKAAYDVGFVKHFTSGDKLYIDVQDNMSWWFDGYNTYIDFKVGNYEVASTSLTRIDGSNMLYYEFNSDVYANYIITLRATSFSAGDWSTKTNQTPDIVFTNSNKSYNAIKLGADNNGTTAVKGMEAFSDDYLVDSFAYYFLQTTSDYCSKEVTATSTIAGVLTSLAAKGTAVKNTFASGNVIHAKSGHANISDEALSRYWNMTHESDHAKGSAYDDFLNLGDTFMAISRSSFETTVADSNNSITLIIVVISGVALLTVGGYFVIRNRKED